MGVRVPAPGQAYSGGDSNLIQAQKTKAAQVDIEVDMQIISTEGTQLSTEIQKFDDWGDAPDNEIEVAMNKVDDWKRKMEKLKREKLRNSEEYYEFQPGSIDDEIFQGLG